MNGCMYERMYECMYECIYECMLMVVIMMVITIISGSSKWSSWGHLEGHLIGLGAWKLLTPRWFRNGPDIELGVSGEYPNEVPVGYW